MGPIDELAAMGKEKRARVIIGAVRMWCSTAECVNFME